MGPRHHAQPPTTAHKMMFVKAALVCCLALAPSVFSFTLPQTQSAVAVRRSEVGRQFSDDDLINYGIWGFIAGLTDYFIRMGLSTDTTATTFRKHNKHKNKKNKKDRKRNKKNKNKIDHKTVEVEEEETMEKDESTDVEPVEDVVAEDAVVAETVEA